VAAFAGRHDRADIRTGNSWLSLSASPNAGRSEPAGYLDQILYSPSQCRYSDLIGAFPTSSAAAFLPKGKSRPRSAATCCLGLNCAQRKLFLGRMRSWKGGGEIRTVATDGITTLAPHFMALGVIDALVEEGMVSAVTSFEYDRASAGAAKKLVTPFAFPTDEWFDWMKAAMNRWENAAW
jgi:hypothetical protein